MVVTRQMRSWIVATINPISCSHPVHHGTFFNVLIDKFIAVSAEKSSSLYTIILENKQTKQHFVLYYNQVYFSLD